MRISEFIDDGSRHQRIFETEVVLPATAEQHHVPTLFLQSLAQRIQIGKSPHQRQRRISPFQDTHRSVGGAVCQPHTTHVLAHILRGGVAVIGTGQLLSAALGGDAIAKFAVGFQSLKGVEWHHFAASRHEGSTDRRGGTQHVDGHGDMILLEGSIRVEGGRERYFNLHGQSSSVSSEVISSCFISTLPSVWIMRLKYSGCERMYRSVECLRARLPAGKSLRTYLLRVSTRRQR